MRPRVFALRASVSVLILGLAMPVFASHTLTVAEARNHIGETETVCGKVASTHYAARTRSRPTFINLDKSYPHQVFTIVIWGSNRAKFGRPETEYLKKDICVTGRIREYRGVPEVVVSNPIQIRVRKSKEK